LVWPEVQDAQAGTSLEKQRWARQGEAEVGQVRSCLSLMPVQGTVNIAFHGKCMSIPSLFHSWRL
jgi:hypothetical protein